MYCSHFMCCLSFFFFKQKTAYEMRISDWSSDVCSSDLVARPVRTGAARTERSIAPATPDRRTRSRAGSPSSGGSQGLVEVLQQVLRILKADRQPRHTGRHADLGALVVGQPRMRRSEEHTSELQSLMRNSYAVFCLKK